MSVLSPAIIVAGILCFVALTTIANDQNTSKFTKIICKNHDEVVSNYSCRIKLVSRYKSLLNITGYLTRQANNLSSVVRLYKKLTVYRPFLINVKEDFCQLFINQYRVPYLNMLYKITKPYTNINHRCPYMGELFIKNTPMDASKLPSLWPTGEYRLDVDAIVNNSPKPSFTTLVYFEVGEKRLV